MPKLWPPVPPAPAPLTEAEMTAAAGQPGFRRALAMAALGLRDEARREWNFTLRGMSDRELLAAAQTGNHFGKRASYGHAMIVDPWGTVLAQCGEGEGAAVATVRPDVVSKIRAQLPSLRHRRPEVTRRG